MNTTEMMVICREVDRETGEIAVYRIETEVTRKSDFQIEASRTPEPRIAILCHDKSAL